MPGVIYNFANTRPLTAAAAAFVTCIAVMVALAMNQDAVHTAIYFLAMVVLFPPALFAAVYLLWRLRQLVGR